MDGDLVGWSMLTARLCLDISTWGTHGDLSEGGREGLDGIRDRYASLSLCGR